MVINLHQALLQGSCLFFAVVLCFAGGADLETFNTIGNCVNIWLLRNCIMRSNKEDHKIAPRSTTSSCVIEITPSLILPGNSIHKLTVLLPMPNGQSITPTDLLDLDDRGRNGCNSSHITLSGGSTSCLDSSNNLYCFSTVSIRTMK